MHRARRTLGAGEDASAGRWLLEEQENDKKKHHRCDTSGYNSGPQQRRRRNNRRRSARRRSYAAMIAAFVFSLLLMVAARRRRPTPQPQLLMGCGEIEKLEIVRLVGTGTKKVAFEVKLPLSLGGGRAIAKRCLNRRCSDANLTKNEAALLRGLQDRYYYVGGDDDNEKREEQRWRGGPPAVVRFYGECDAPLASNNLSEERDSQYSDRSLKNFSIGHTIVVEMGEPLSTSVLQVGASSRSCLSEFYTPADVEDLRDIARAYANYDPGNPLVLGRADNQIPHQYAVRITADSATRGGRGTILHVDLDDVHPCEKRLNIPEVVGLDCTVEKVLERNCRVVALLANLPGLDCSFPAVAAPETTDYGDRINVSRAVRECTERRQRIRRRRSRSRRVSSSS